MKRNDRELELAAVQLVTTQVTVDSLTAASMTAHHPAAVEDATTEFIRNPESRVACLLLLDTSGSMLGAPIEELNAGLQVFVSSLGADSLAAKRAETAILTFGGTPALVQDFATLDHLQVPRLTAAGGTPMGAAILRGLELVAERRRAYRKNAIESYRPWVFLLSDGAPTDPTVWPNAVAQVKRGLERKEFEFFAIGVGDQADMNKLAELSLRPPARLQGLRFEQFFRWLSCSLTQCSRSRPGEAFSLPRLDDWGTINNP